MTILVYDVHASESGALAVLNDFYKQVADYNDKSIKWIFVVSTPEFEDKENITVLRFPWVKKSWLHRLIFEYYNINKIIKQYKIDKVYSMQNKGVPLCNKQQCIYLHLPFVLTDYKFEIKRDGKKLWLYQNVLSKSIFKSLRKASKVIVQTKWMKEECVKKAHADSERIEVIAPDISMNMIGKFKDTLENRKRFFYPATAFTYKNHLTLLKACNYIQEKGYTDYEVILTIRGDENSYAESLFDYARKHKLNISFRGSIQRNEVFELYTKSSLVFPSFIESFGMPLLEARNTNTFVIASKCSFSEEILENYENLYLFEQYDYVELAKQMLYVMNSEKRLIESSQANKGVTKSSLVEIILAK